MGKPIRILIAIFVILSLVLISRNQAAWAANSSSSQKVSLSVSAEKNKRCDKQPDKNKPPKCHGDDDDDDDGTVKPPKNDVKMCEKGTYSIGGAATVELKNGGKRNCVEANTRPAEPALDQTPSSGMILSQILNLVLPGRNRKVDICFAVPPGMQTKIYSFSQGSWNPVKTTVKNGIACATVLDSGKYGLIGQ